MVDQPTAYHQLKATLEALWPPISAEMVDALFALCRPLSLKKGAQFLSAGDIPAMVGFNLSGFFRLFYLDADGNDFTKSFSTPNKFLISYSALVQKRPSYFSIEALVDSDILQFRYADWMRLIDADERWYPVLFKLVEAVYITKEMREKSFLLDDATTRYLAFRDEYPTLEEQLKLYHVASFIGITPEALSRIRKALDLT